MRTLNNGLFPPPPRILTLNYFLNRLALISRILSSRISNILSILFEVTELKSLIVSIFKEDFIESKYFLSKDFLIG